MLRGNHESRFCTMARAPPASTARMFEPARMFKLRHRLIFVDEAPGSTARRCSRMLSHMLGLASLSPAALPSAARGRSLPRCSALPGLPGPPRHFHRPQLARTGSAAGSR